MIIPVINVENMCFSMNRTFKSRDARYSIFADSRYIFFFGGGGGTTPSLSCAGILNIIIFMLLELVNYK